MIEVSQLVSKPLIEKLDGFVPPLEVFKHFKDDPYPFFLDSGMDPKKLGRYSFIGSSPFLVFRSRGRKIEIIHRGRIQCAVGDPFRALSGLLKQFRFDSSHLSVPFAGGAVGYFAYDLCHFIERLPCTTLDDMEFPDCCLPFYDAGIVFDHLLGEIYLCGCDLPERYRTEETGAERQVERLRDRLQSVLLDDPVPEIVQEVSPVVLRSNFTEAEYLAAVRKAKNYIAAGDIYQVNLSQRFLGTLSTSPFEVYERLRRCNPAPFSAYLDFGDVKVLSSSPERFLQFSGETRWVYTRPIKGTRPRGATPWEDEGLAHELFSSEKDRAELVMIVDLERNDLGRICEIGSVHVPELIVLERYTTVHHLVATVAGRLPPGRDRIDLLRATFPGGSITGAPKIRAMEIIDELEPTRRGVYTGAIGYLSFTGDMDLNIAIRTMVVKGQKISFHVGGGIVADSDPAAEYQETLHKARALMEVLGGHRRADT